LTGRPGSTMLLVAIRLRMDIRLKEETAVKLRIALLAAVTAVALLPGLASGVASAAAPAVAASSPTSGWTVAQLQALAAQLGLGAVKTPEDVAALAGKINLNDPATVKKVAAVAEQLGLGDVTHAKKVRTVVTTDMEQDDYASLIRYLLYTNDIDTQGIIYTSSRFHWAGDGKGTPFFLAGREYTTPQTSWRWTGTTTIQDIAIPAYAQVYANLKANDYNYPSPAYLQSITKIGNIDFEGEMDHDTDGSNLIKKLLLDNDPRPLYLQAWGGTSTIARALKSIQDQYSGTAGWAALQAKISAKAVILASGFQDTTYADYIAPTWPALKVEQLSAGYSTWGYNCNFARTPGAQSTRGLPGDQKYFQGAFIKANIQTGPYGKLYRSWLDGQAMPGDQLDIFGIPSLASGGWCPPFKPYDFLSEGDDVAFFPLVHTGIEAPQDSNLGGWGGRAVQTTASPNLWTMVPTELDGTGTPVANYTTLRWASAAQNDFAERIQWTMTPNYKNANHEPLVTTLNGGTVSVTPGQSVQLQGLAFDPDGKRITVKWWQYREEGTYPGTVSANSPASLWTWFKVPADAQPGQTISMILQVTDSGKFPLTRYSRVTLQVK
jgi:hypothetical protein